MKLTRGGGGISVTFEVGEPYEGQTFEFHCDRLSGGRLYVYRPISDVTIYNLVRQYCVKHGLDNIEFGT